MKYPVVAKADVENKGAITAIEIKEDRFHKNIDRVKTIYVAVY